MSVVVVQHDWFAGLRHNETVWAFHKVLGQNSTHGFLQDKNFSIVSQVGRQLAVKCSITKEAILYVAPLELYDAIHTKSVQNLDVADTGELGVSVSTNNTITVWELDTGSVKAYLTGHLFDVTTVKFFPSGNIIMTSGVDMQIKLWDTHTKKCKLTMTGHTGAVTDTAIVENGENIISVSKDGTARLWNGAEMNCLSILIKLDGAINCCAITIAQNNMDLPPCEREEDNLEIGTKRKLLAVGCEDGKMIIIDVFSRTIIKSFNLTCEINCLKWLPSALLVVGLENGSVFKVDSKNLNELPVLLCHDHASSVLCICSLKDGFLIGRRDGLCQYYSTDGVNKIQLSGADCDPVYSIAHYSRYVFTGCRDGKIRKYSVGDMDV